MTGWRRYAGLSMAAMSSPGAADADGLPPSAARPTAAVPSARVGWQVRLFGAVEAAGPSSVLQRWPSRAVAALLARLALQPGVAHPREELVELLWPGVALDVGRNRLRQALSTLKTLLESPEAGVGPVLLADRQTVRVVPRALDSDAHCFQRLLRDGDAAQALALYRGEFMPGFYEEWALDERRRLSMLRDRAVDAADAVVPPAPAPAAEAAPAAKDAHDLSAAQLPSGLPHYWTRPFGVELTASRLRALACAHRLVTVVGPGGSGKTRLAVEVGQSLQQAPEWSPDGREAVHFERIAFVPLVACHDAPQAMDALCSALRVDSGDRDPHQRLVAALSGQRTLLLLDNVEQVVDDFAGSVGRLLAALPGLHLLVTSRRLLELDGETAFELDGLAVPAPELPLADTASSPAVALFVDRARAARADFRLGPRNAEAVTGLVRLLAGMPLAIELAASRVRTLSPQDLLVRLQAGAGTPMLDLLARGAQRPSADTRHASMRHVVEWSWRQLTGPQVAVAQALSVFGAPARLEAVAAALGIDAESAEAALGALHDVSLVRRQPDPQDDGGPQRWMLLEPVREFAAERCDPARSRQSRQRLRQWLIGFARAAARQGPAAVAPELSLVQSAIVSAPADGASQTAVVLAVALRDYWEADCPPLTVLLALEQAIGDVDHPPLRADALELLAYARGSAGFVNEALAHAEAAVEAATDDRQRALAMARRVWCLYLAGRMQSDFDTPLGEALRLAERCGDRMAQATVLRLQGVILSNLRLDYAGAETLMARVQRLWEEVGNRQAASWALLNRAAMWVWMGRVEEGLAAHEACERMALADGNWVGVMTAGRQIGRIHIRQRSGPEAAAALRRSLRVAWARHHVQLALHGLLHLSHALALGDELETAARLHGFATAQWASVYGTLNPIEAREMRQARRLIRLRLGPGRTESLIVGSVGMTLAEAMALGLGQAPGGA